MSPTFADIAKAQYVLLTTFTKDGRPKPTPIWAAPDGDRLLVITQEKSWKVKRIRNTPRVTLAVCDMGGHPEKRGRRGERDVLDKSQTGVVYDAVGREYGLIGRVFNLVQQAAGRHAQERRPRTAVGELNYASLRRCSPKNAKTRAHASSVAAWL